MHVVHVHASGWYLYDHYVERQDGGTSAGLQFGRRRGSKLYTI